MTKEQALALLDRKTFHDLYICKNLSLKDIMTTYGISKNMIKYIKGYYGYTEDKISYFISENDFYQKYNILCEEDKHE